MLSTCPLNVAPPSASTSTVARWPARIVLQLRLLEVRRDPHVAERHERQQRLPGLHDLPGFDRLAADDAGRRRGDARALQIQLRLRERGRRLLHARLGHRGAGARDLHLLRRRARRLQPPPAPARPRRAPGGRAARRPRSRSAAAATSDCAASAAARAASAAATAASYCCCGISSFATSPFSRSTSRGGLRRGRLALALPRLRRRRAARAPLRSGCSATATAACASSTSAGGAADAGATSTLR